MPWYENLYKTAPERMADKEAKALQAHLSPIEKMILLDVLMKSSATRNVPVPHADIFRKAEQGGVGPSGLPPITDMLRRQEVEKMMPTTMGGASQLMGTLEAAKKVLPDVLSAGPGTSLIQQGETSPFYTAPFKPETPSEPREVKTWKTPENDIINIPNNQLPPPGSVPYSKPGEESAAPTDLRSFELANYGKEVPGLRGSPEYKTKYLDWIKIQKEQSPYVDALNRQTTLQTKKWADEYRKEFYTQPEVKTYLEMRQKFDVMVKALEESRTTNNRVAVDQAIITLFNKMTDPESVVRESEYARTPQDLAIWNRVKGKVQKWLAGGAGLTDEDRQALVTMGSKFMQVADMKYRGRLSEYQGYIINIGADPNKYFTPYGKPVESKTMADDADALIKKYRKK